jgi:glycosyltransferase involved in cell wall biosynthesis
MFGLRGLRPDLQISGFETAFSEIAPRLVKRGHAVTIYCRSGAHSSANRGRQLDGVDLVYMPSPGGKNLSAPTSTGLAVAHALATKRFDVWFFVNVGMGYHAAMARLSGRPVVMNVDGLDWQRGKWGPAARAYFRSAARMAVRFCTTLVTDAEAMRTFYREQFARDSEMIPYGADIETSSRPDLVESLGLSTRGYYLIVSRLIPENSLEAMVSGFVGSRTRRRLVIVGDANYHDAFHERLRSIADGDARVKMLGRIADQSLLKELWCNAYAYLHGHSVGGTNPALLRAMGCGTCIVARDTVFNREVLGEAGAFFDDAASVTTSIDALDLDEERVARMRCLGPPRIEERYTWERIVDDYERVFADAVAVRRR